MPQLTGSGGCRPGMPQLQTWMSAAKADENSSGISFPQAMPSIPFQSQSQETASSTFQASIQPTFQASVHPSLTDQKKKNPAVMALLERMETAGLIDKDQAGVTGPSTTGATVSTPMTGLNPRPPISIPLTIRPPSTLTSPSLTSSVVQRPTGGVI